MPPEEVARRMQELQAARDAKRLVRQKGDALLTRCDFAFRFGSELVPLFSFKGARTNQDVVYFWVESHLDMPIEKMAERLQFEIGEMLRYGWGGSV